MAEEAGSWKRAWLIFFDKRVAIILILEAAAAVPIFLALYGLKPSMPGHNYSLGMFVGLAGVFTLTQGLRVLLGPIVDTLPVPVLTRRMGRRRSWILLAMLVSLAALGGLLSIDVLEMRLTAVVLGFAAIVCSALLTTVLDGFRIDCAGPRRQGALAVAADAGAAAPFFGLTLAGILWTSSAQLSPPVLYGLLCAMAVGIVTTCLMREPEPRTGTQWAGILENPRVHAFLGKDLNLSHAGRMITAWLLGAIVGPTSEFFRRQGGSAWTHIAMLVSFYGAMTVTTGAWIGVVGPAPENLEPFGLRSGLEIIYGVPMAVLGSLVAGILVYRVGVLQTLRLALSLLIVAKALDILAAWMGFASPGYAVALAAVCGAWAFAGVAIMAYASTLAMSAIAASQFALLALALPVASLIIYLIGQTGIVQGRLNAWVVSILFCLAGLWLVARLRRAREELPVAQSG